MGCRGRGGQRSRDRGEEDWVGYRRGGSEGVGVEDRARVDKEESVAEVSVPDVTEQDVVAPLEEQDVEKALDRHPTLSVLWCTTV